MPVDVRVLDAVALWLAPTDCVGELLPLCVALNDCVELAVCVPVKVLVPLGLPV